MEWHRRGWEDGGGEAERRLAVGALARGAGRRARRRAGPGATPPTTSRLLHSPTRRFNSNRSCAVTQLSPPRCCPPKYAKVEGESEETPPPHHFTSSPRLSSHLPRSIRAISRLEGVPPSPHQHAPLTCTVSDPNPDIRASLRVTPTRTESVLVRASCCAVESAFLRRVLCRDGSLCPRYRQRPTGFPCCCRLRRRSLVRAEANRRDWVVVGTAAGERGACGGSQLRARQVHCTVGCGVSRRERVRCASP